MPNGHWLTPYGEVTQHGVGPGTYGAFGAGIPGGGLMPIIPTTTQPAPWQATWEAGQAPWSATAATAGGTYIVQPGDMLWAIARQYGTTVQAIAQANGIANPNLIYPGQQLVIPGAGGGGGAPPVQPPAGGGGGAPPSAGGGGGAPTGGGGYWSGPLPAPPTGDYWTYTLVWGDTLWSLAQRYGTTVEELARLNQIPDPNRIAAGAQIYIPGVAPGAAPPGPGEGPEEPEPEEPPATPSWWGAEVFGEQGWVYLPTTPGEQATQWQEPGEEGYAPPPVGPGWYNLRGVQYFNQLPAQWRDWLNQVMQGQQEHWESPTIAPIQWMPSTQAYQRAPLYMWEPLAGGTAGGQHAIQPPGAPYAPPGLQYIEEDVWGELPEPYTPPPLVVEPPSWPSAPGFPARP